MNAGISYRKTIIFIVVTVLLSGVFIKWYIVEAFNREYMSLSQVKKKYGNEAFNSKSFRENSDLTFRSKMIYQLIKNKHYVGKSVSSVRQGLGDPTGYFFSDLIPAYIIEERQRKGNRFLGETWQVVFFLTEEGDKISEVKVHKQCCYNSLVEWSVVIMGSFLIFLLDLF